MYVLVITPPGGTWLIYKSHTQGEGRTSISHILTGGVIIDFPIARLQIDSTGVRRVRSRSNCLYPDVTLLTLVEVI